MRNVVWFAGVVLALAAPVREVAAEPGNPRGVEVPRQGAVKMKGKATIAGVGKAISTVTGTAMVQLTASDEESGTIGFSTQDVEITQSSASGPVSTTKFFASFTSPPTTYTERRARFGPIEYAPTELQEAAQVADCVFGPLFVAKKPKPLRAEGQIVLTSATASGSLTANRTLSKVKG